MLSSYCSWEMDFCSSAQHKYKVSYHCIAIPPEAFQWGRSSIIPFNNRMPLGHASSSVRFVVKDSVEESIMELQEKKRVLIRGAFGDKEAQSKLQKLGPAACLGKGEGVSL